MAAFKLRRYTLYKVTVVLQFILLGVCITFCSRCYLAKSKTNNYLHRSCSPNNHTENSTFSNNLSDDFSLKKKIYIVTPTYQRITQRADVTRLYNTLRWVQNMHWVVVEDSHEPTDTVRELVLNSHIRNYTVVAIKTPASEDPKLNKASRTNFHRGVEQRNLGLKIIKELVESERLLDKQFEAVVYLCDDDNSYDTRLFEEIRLTKVVSVFNVGLSGGLSYEGPTVSEVTGKINGWHAVWMAQERTYPIDMAGFSFHVDLLFNVPMPLLSHKAALGFLETDFLERLVGTEGSSLLEPRALNSILVWHTRTENPKTVFDKTLAPDPAIKV